MYCQIPKQINQKFGQCHTSFVYSSDIFNFLNVYYIWLYAYICLHLFMCLELIHVGVHVGVHS